VLGGTDFLTINFEIYERLHERILVLLLHKVVYLRELDILTEFGTPLQLLGHLFLHVVEGEALSREHLADGIATWGHPVRGLLLRRLCLVRM